MSQTIVPQASASPMDDAVRANVEALAAAQRAGDRLAGLPEPVTTLEQAYSIQDRLVHVLGGVGGWKVAPLTASGETRCSPIPVAFIRAPADTMREPPESGLLVEVEIAIRLGSDLLPVNGAVTRDDVAKAIATVHTAIEIMNSRFVAGLDAPDLDRTADLQSCGGVMLSAGLSDWRDLEFSAEIARIAGEHATITAQVTQPATARTLDAIAWLATHAAGRGLPLRAGQTIITGARLGPLVLPSERDLTVRAGSLGAIRITA